MSNLATTSKTISASFKQDFQSAIAHFSKGLSEIKDQTETVSDRVHSHFESDRMAIYFWSIRFIFAGLAFLALFFSYEISIWVSLGLLPPILIMIVVNEIVIRGRQSSLRKEAERLKSDFDKMKDHADLYSNTTPKSATSFSLFDHLIKSVTAGAKQTIATIALVIPIFGSLLKAESIAERQRHFLDSYRYALTTYGFRDIQNIEFDIYTQPTNSESELVWLDQLVETTKKTYGLDQSIFRLVFYDALKRTSDLEVVWSDVRKTDSLQNLVTVLLDNNLLEVPKELPGVRDVLLTISAGMDTYSLDILKIRCRAFFVDLARFKEQCLQALKIYNLGIEMNSNTILDFIPTNPQTDSWKDELVRKISDLLSENFLHIKLLISEAIGDLPSNTSTLKSIVLVHGQLKLAAFLVQKRIVRGSTEIYEPTSTKQLSDIITTLSRFSVASAETRLAKLQDDILRVRRSILVTKHKYSLKLDEKFGLNFVPANPSLIEEEMIESAASSSRIDSTVLKLLYASVVGNEDPNRIFIDSIKPEPEKLRQLSEVLALSDVVRTQPTDARLSKLLFTQEKFDLNLISNLFDHYAKLQSISSNLMAFLEEHEIATLVSREIAFEELLVQCPPKGLQKLSHNLATLGLRSIISNYSARTLTEVERSDLGLASVALFLTVTEEPESGPFCEEISYREFPTRILYEYSAISTKSGFNLIKPSLRNALLASFQPIGESDIYYQTFRAALRGRMLYTRITYLASYQQGQVLNKLAEVQKAGATPDVLFENLRDAIADVLKDEISPPIVEDLLLAQVLSAYLVTVPGNKPAISGVVDNLPTASKQLFEETGDLQYKDLIIMSSGSGNRTRIGLVPLNMTFAKFSDLFMKVFQKANETYDPSQIYRCFLMRVFPSEDAMTVINEGSGDISPLSTIQDLMKDDLPNYDNVKLLSITTSAKEGNVKVKEVLLSIIDSNKADLLTLGGKHLKEIVDNAGNLDELQHGELDKKLFLIYGHGISKVSELALEVMSRIRSQGETNAAMEFTENLKKSFPKRINVDQQDTEKFSQALYSTLRSVGIVASF